MYLPSMVRVVGVFVIDEEVKKLNDGDVQLKSMSSYYTNKLKFELLSAGEMFKYLKL